MLPAIRVHVVGVGRVVVVALLEAAGTFVLVVEICGFTLSLYRLALDKLLFFGPI